MPSNSLTEQIQSPHQFFEDCQNLGFYSLLFLAQALAEQNIIQPMKLMVVTSNVHDVTGDEKLCPEKATVLGPCKVIPQEYSNITCCNVDIVLPESVTKASQKLIDHLLTEFTAQSTDVVVAYRGHHRWIQTYKAVHLDESVAGKTRLRKGGVYLITGGLGGVGLVLAEYLAQTVQAKLILLGRKSLPEKDQWLQWLVTHDEYDEVSCKLKKLMALEELGAQIQVISADVANEQQMQRAIAIATERFGAIHGVIHAAGNAEDSHCTIQETSKIESQLQFHPKVHGLLVLEKVLQGKELDFCQLTSSLASVLGGLGFVAYSAANIFMDAFVHKYSQTSSYPWISLNWDDWGVKAAEQGAANGAILPKLNMTPKGGVEAFERLLLLNTVPQVVVSTGSLQTRIDQWIKLESLRETESSQNRELLSNHQRPNLQTAYLTPRNEMEQNVANIWQQILGVQQIGIHDNFFELGGDSLLGTQVISHLRKAFQMDLPLSSLFNEPTIAGISGCIESISKKDKKLFVVSSIHNENQSSSSTCDRILPVYRDINLPLSFAQQRLWVLDQLNPGDCGYNIPSALRFDGLLDIAAFKQSINEIIRRHEILRTNFITVDSQARQKIALTLTLDIPLLDLTKLPKKLRDAEVVRLSVEEAQRPFNLIQDPLLRITLLQLDKAEYVVLFTMHHIVSDYWTMGVLIQEFVELYKAFSRGERSPLPDLQIQYADFAVWQRQWLQGEKLKTQLSYWKGQLEGAPTMLQLPLDRPRPQVQSSRGAVQTLTISENLTEALKTLSRQEGVTLYMTLLAAFNLLLYYYTGQDDILVGSPIANRNRAETERLIGFFVNTLVMRTNLSGNPSFRELLGRVREISLGAYSHQDLPFEKLVESLQLERNLSYNTLFQVWFVLQNVNVQALELPNLKITPLEIESGTARHDLKLDLSETRDS